MSVPRDGMAVPRSNNAWVRPIPPGYTSMKEALQRARNMWSQVDAPDKLVGWLIAEHLISWIVDKQAIPHRLAGAFWRDEIGQVDIEHGIIRDYPGMAKEARIVFLAADLNSKLPWPEEWAQAKGTPSAEPVGLADQATPADNEQTNESADLPRPRGRKRTKGNDILKAMREMDRKELDDMSYKTMEHRFCAAGSTCARYRKQALTKNSDN
jgi:hypothetical protein